MSRVHIVAPGEGLSAIAARYGFPSWRTLYDDPANASLRRARPNPNILLAGDEVTIPDIHTYRLTTNEPHTLRVSLEIVRLKLRVMEDIGGEASVATYRLEVFDGSEPFEGSLEDGCLDVPISPRARRARLTLYEEDGTTVANVFELRIGALDPLDTVSGVQSRLIRLGYRIGRVDGICGPRTLAALAAFRAVREITDDEAPFGSATLDALEALLGE